MPTIPSIKTLQANTPNILNAIRTDLGGTYGDLIPMCANTNESIRTIGASIMNQQMLQNSFLNALMNRIGMTIITSKSYSNPWSMFKKGMLDFGETIEEIYVAMAEPFQYNPDDAEQTLYKQHKPDVSSAFHTMNFAKQYPQTIYREQLQQAFLSMSGVTDLISKITESMYTGMEYDEFIMMKYMLGRIALNGKIKPIAIPAVSKANLEDIVTIIKGTSSKFEYMSNLYNMSHVQTHSQKDEQYVILNSTFESQIDVSLLSSAFNMEKAQFMGQRVGVDSFGVVDTARLSLLFKDDVSYVPFTPAELAMLDALPCMILDKEFFMIFDNLMQMTDVPNPKGLYWNYFLHVWKTFSVSPFANAVLFTVLTPSITSVSATPSVATCTKGSILQCHAEVVTEGFADSTVKWAVGSSNCTITPDGKLSIGKNEIGSAVEVGATSVFDPTKSDTIMITIA